MTEITADALLLKIMRKAEESMREQRICWRLHWDFRQGIAQNSQA